MCTARISVSPGTKLHTLEVRWAWRNYSFYSDLKASVISDTDGWVCSWVGDTPEMGGEQGGEIQGTFLCGSPSPNPDVTDQFRSQIFSWIPIVWDVFVHPLMETIVCKKIRVFKNRYFRFSQSLRRGSCKNLPSSTKKDGIKSKDHAPSLCLFVVVQSLSSVQFFATPWTAAHQASVSFTTSQSLLTLMSMESVMPSNHLIFCHLSVTLLLLPSVFPSISVFSNKSALRIRWPKDWSFSFSISPSNEYSGLISFRMDWLDLLAVCLLNDTIGKQKAIFLITTWMGLRMKVS